MFKQELPLMFPDDAQVAKVRGGIFDPFEYLMLRHRAGKLRTDFSTSLGTVAYHVACHQRVQNIGLKTKDVLELVPDTQVIAIERCSGHDGTYAVKTEFYATAMKLVRPVAKRVADAKPDLVLHLAAWRAERLGRRSAATAAGRAPLAAAMDAPLELAFLGDLQRGVQDVPKALAAALAQRPAHLLISSHFGKMSLNSLQLLTTQGIMSLRVIQNQAAHMAFAAI